MQQELTISRRISTEPDLAKIFRLNRRNNMLAGFQGVLQVAIILVMAHLAVG